MSKEELYDKYPQLFALRHLGRHESCMARGIEVGNGWLSIIDRLSAEIIQISPDIQYEQIKEKFGVLRIYTSGATDDNRELIRTIISKYVDISLTVCETCGDVGHLRQHQNWRTVCCDKHDVDDMDSK